MMKTRLFITLLVLIVKPALIFASCDAPGDYIKIYDLAGLEDIRNAPTANYYLCADIDLSGSSPQFPVADFFMGVFDGGGHRISNAVAEASIFNKNNGEIRNLQLINYEFHADSDFGGALVHWNTNQGLIENIIFDGKLLTKSVFGSGSLVDLNYGYIQDCYINTVVRPLDEISINFIGGAIGQNYGPVTNVMASVDINLPNGNTVGGLMGRNDQTNFELHGVVHNVHVYGRIQAIGGVGGLIGEHNNEKAELRDSSFNGSVTGSASSIGGLIGYGGNTNLYSNIVQADVSGLSDVGGVVGHGSGFGIYNHKFSGKVSQISGGNGGNIGGIIGTDFNGSVTAPMIRNAEVVGEISGSRDVGGIAGNYSLGKIRDSSVQASISGVTNVGGIVGNLVGGFAPEDEGLTLVYSSYFDGVLTGRQSNWSCSSSLISFANCGNIGGIVGWGEGNLDVGRVFSVGEINAQSHPAGGLVGAVYSDQTKITIAHSYSHMNVTGRQKGIGGAVGSLACKDSAQCRLLKSYTTGRVNALQGDLSKVGGLVGFKAPTDQSQVNNSFWDLQQSGIDHSDGGNGISTQAMMSRDTFSNWDFEGSNRWVLDEGHSYPWFTVNGYDYDSSLYLSFSFDSFEQVGGVRKIVDASNYKNDFNLPKTARLVAGRSGRALELKGKGGIHKDHRLVPIRDTNSISLCTFVKSNKLSGQMSSPQVAYLSNEDEQEGAGIFFGTFTANSSLVGLRVGGQNGASIEDELNIADSQWHQVAASYDATNGKMRLFLDGQLKLEKTVGSIDIQSPTLSNVLVGEGFEGSLDEMKVFRYAIKSSQDLQEHCPFE